MSEKINIGIIGAAGYTGGELIRLLLNHPNVELKLVHSKSNAGKLLSDVHGDLVGETDLKFDGPELNFDSLDALFLCFGHGESKRFVSEHQIPSSIKIIDLANDFRLSADSSDGGRKFVYGLPELNRELIKKSDTVANPGCFATTIQLGLLPLAQAGLLNRVYTTGITGSTGAGQSLSTTSHFSWRSNNIQAYKTLTHQHLGEIHQSLHQLQDSFPDLSDKKLENAQISFVPWRGDFTRGIFISSQIETKKSLSEIEELFFRFYDDHPFTHISKEPIALKQVVNTNKCLIQLEQTGSMLVVHSVADNLLKGASGQAVQNMNLMFGFEETAGLKLKANYF
ncbi:MAG: N-acetyl-gamma-glutamyl-phosphate reductase [Chitinophagaceae bacterium]|nr:N-acetyl-gamma-glutamyl-phosphate reductase [Chitinophagaceae bacterium]